MNAHPLIAGVLEEDEGRVKDGRVGGWRSSWKQPVYITPAAKRRLRILNGLFQAVARAGGEPWIRDHEATDVGVGVHQQAIRIALEQVKLTARRDSSAKGGEARLRLALSTGTGIEHVGWIDGEEGRLETKVAEIAAEVFVIAEMQYRESCVRHHQWRVELKARREEELRVRRAEEERKERERQAAAAQARVDSLLAQSDRLRQANEIRLFVEEACHAALARNPPPDAAALARWRSWALAEADRIDPVISGAFLEEIGLEEGGGT